MGRQRHIHGTIVPQRHIHGTVVPVWYVPAQYISTIQATATNDGRAAIHILYDWPIYVPVVFKIPALYWNRVAIYRYLLQRVPVVPSDSTGTIHSNGPGVQLHVRARFFRFSCRFNTAPADLETSSPQRVGLGLGLVFGSGLGSGWSGHHVRRFVRTCT